MIYIGGPLDSQKSATPVAGTFGVSDRMTVVETLYQLPHSGTILVADCTKEISDWTIIGRYRRVGDEMRFEEV